MKYAVLGISPKVFLFLPSPFFASFRVDSRRDLPWQTTSMQALIVLPWHNASNKKPNVKMDPTNLNKEISSCLKPISQLNSYSDPVTPASLAPFQAPSQPS